MTETGHMAMDIHAPQITEAAHEWAYALCEFAGEAREYADTFWDRLTQSEGVYGEYVNYMLTQDFACTYSIDGVTIIDIMVWQIDRFKAGMDTVRPERDNPDRMLLTAFVTMLDMEERPEELLDAYRRDTGTDYPGKF
ncbi:MAG: hypothetical protein IJS12_09885 [Lachnospiraceae bacterium]|nr:hypothetical protein [Lachnospiraceae bacterium]